jgi:hypothetical protein
MPVINFAAAFVFSGIPVFLTGVPARLAELARHCEPTGRANARPMTGSAKQSIDSTGKQLDCFVASLLAMTKKIHSCWRPDLMAAL